MSNDDTSAPVSNLRFRKKPVVIEAFELTEKRRTDNRDWPHWLNEAWNRDPGEPGAFFIDRPIGEAERLLIHTLEGAHVISFGDWIVRGVRDELYPVKPEIFAATYEAESAPVSAQGGAAAGEALRWRAHALANEHLDVCVVRPGVTTHGVFCDSVLAALARIREEVRAEALREAASVCRGAEADWKQNAVEHERDGSSRDAIKCQAQSNGARVCAGAIERLAASTGGAGPKETK